MTATLEFFYDYVSSYSYMANTVVTALEDVEVRYRPMFLGGVMKATGNSPPGTVPAKGRYLGKDLHRWARHYDVPFRFNSVFPQNTLSALRLALVAQHRGTFELLHQPLFDAIYVHDRDLSDPAVLADIVTAAGLDAEDYAAAIGTTDIKDELKANTEEAIARGAFGAPTFFVGDEMFFGNDRFDFIRAALAEAAGAGTTG